MSDVNTVQGDQSIFDDSGASVAGEASAPADKPAKDDVTKATEDAKDDQKGEGDIIADKTDQTGAKKVDGTPPEAEDDPEAVTDDKGQKFIPEHRFKAALKKVTEERDAAMGKVAEYEKPEPIPVPDKDADPEGHALHIRMEASKQVMMDLRPDYQEKIDHFATMAESNPLLNQAVAGHPIPAKLAYDIAAKDLEIKEALALKESDDWKEYQEFKKTKVANTPATPDEKLGKTVAKGLNSVPNLNRSTNASPNRNVRKISAAGGDDPLWDDYKR